MSEKADGTVMVVRERNSKRDDVLDAIDRLQMSGGTLLGVVFIGSRRRGEYRPYHYYYARTASEPENGNSR